MDYKKEEIREHLNDFLKENDGVDPNELHHEAFNMDYYIIGTYQAEQWCGDKVFQIINFIKDYEQDNFGQVTTDLSNAEKVVNMYAYIIGEEVVSEYLEGQKVAA